MKKTFYIWHRYLGIASCLVVLTWSLSGMLHPLMSWFQPRPSEMMINRQPLQPEDFVLSPEEVLRLNRIEKYEDFNIVTFEGRTFYQVRTEPDRPLIYIESQKGELLSDGDRRYAVWLARNYLQDFQSPVSEVGVVREFDREYKIINKLLPVYRVKFDRTDEMRAYVDTSSGMLGTLIDRTKGVMMSIFVNLHNWDWAGGNDTFRVGLLVVFALLVVSMALSGIVVYGLFWRSFRPLTQSTKTTRNVVKRYHRTLGLTVSVTMVLWGGSAAYHAIEKPSILAEAKTRYAQQSFAQSDAPYSLGNLIQDAGVKSPVINISMVRIDGETFYQIVRADRTTDYYASKSGALIDGANDRYVRQLASGFSGQADASIVSIRPVVKFENEYGFINKRLPVTRVEYNDGNHTRYFVDPMQGLLALELGDRKRLESYSFNIFHKWSFLDWAGRTTRDVIMIIFVLLQGGLAGTGLLLFLFWRRAIGPARAIAGPRSEPDSLT